MTTTVTATVLVPACDVEDALLDTYGRHSVRLSRAHEGSGYRVQQVLAKARRGERIRVAVLGGSGPCPFHTSPSFTH